MLPNNRKSLVYLTLGRHILAEHTKAFCFSYPEDTNSLLILSGK